MSGFNMSSGTIIDSPKVIPDTRQKPNRFERVFISQPMTVVKDADAERECLERARAALPSRDDLRSAAIQPPTEWLEEEWP